MCIRDRDYADRKGGSYLFSDAFYYDANGDVTGRNNYTQDLPSNTKVYTLSLIHI